MTAAEGGGDESIYFRTAMYYTTTIRIVFCLFGVHKQLIPTLTQAIFGKINELAYFMCVFGVCYFETGILYVCVSCVLF